MDKKFMIYIALLTIFCTFIFTTFFTNYEFRILYHCDDPEDYAKCDHIGQHYGLQNGRCIIDNRPDQMCRTGWTNRNVTEGKTMEEQLLNAIWVLLTLLISNYGIKIIRAYPLLSKLWDLVQTSYDSMKDKRITHDEKAAIFDRVYELIEEVWQVVKGFGFWKTNLSK